MQPRISISKITRVMYVGVTAAFCFFLTASAPHRVHHFFDEFPEIHQEAHPDDGHDHNHDSERNSRPNGESNCVLQASASRCQLSLAAPTAPAPSPTVVATIFILTIAQTALDSFPKAFQIRAPPLA
jgi:hypothetical protein